MENKRSASVEEGERGAPSPKMARVDGEDEHVELELDDDDENAGENGGVHPRRWTEEEDERLRRAVEQMGEGNWKSIGTAVGTRNHMQCLQRWKKVLRPGLVKGLWAPGEDTLLTKLVAEGFTTWGQLAEHLPGRTSNQCRERWCHHLDPSIVKGEWSPQEDQTIIDSQEKLGNKWSSIAQALPGRTENAIKMRFKAIQRKKSGTRSDNWHMSAGTRYTPDTRMRSLAAQAASMAMSKAKNHTGSNTPVGMPQDPGVIKALVQASSGHKLLTPAVTQDQAHDTDHVEQGPATPAPSDDHGYGAGRGQSNGGGQDLVRSGLGGPGAAPEVGAGGSAGWGGVASPPALVWGPSAGTGTGVAAGTAQDGGGSDDERTSHPRRWTEAEDERLRQAVKEMGAIHWKDIAGVVGTRSHVQCLQRWKKVLRPGLVKGPWRADEDENLVGLISQGFKNWGQLASHMPGRTSKQCRERWCHHLDPSINKGEWTAEEDHTITAMQEKLGNKWSTIAQMLPGRTENSIKIRFKAIKRSRRNLEAAALAGKARPDGLGTIPAPAQAQAPPLAQGPAPGRGLTTGGPASSVGVSTVPQSWAASVGPGGGGVASSGGSPAGDALHTLRLAAAVTAAGDMASAGANGTAHAALAHTAATAAAAAAAAAGVAGGAPGTPDYGSPGQGVPKAVPTVGIVPGLAPGSWAGTSTPPGYIHLGGLPPSPASSTGSVPQAMAGASGVGLNLGADPSVHATPLTQQLLETNPDLANAGGLLLTPASMGQYSCVYHQPAVNSTQGRLDPQMLEELNWAVSRSSTPEGRQQHELQQQQRRQQEMQEQQRQLQLQLHVLQLQQQLQAQAGYEGFYGSGVLSGAPAAPQLPMDPLSAASGGTASAHATWATHPMTPNSMSGGFMAGVVTSQAAGGTIAAQATGGATAASQASQAAVTQSQAQVAGGAFVPLAGQPSAALVAAFLQAGPSGNFSQMWRDSAAVEGGGAGQRGGQGQGDVQQGGGGSKLGGFVPSRPSFFDYTDAASLLANDKFDPGQDVADTGGGLEVSLASDPYFTESPPPVLPASGGAATVASGAAASSSGNSTSASSLKDGPSFKSMYEDIALSNIGGLTVGAHWQDAAADSEDAADVACLLDAADPYFF